MGSLKEKLPKIERELQRELMENPRLGFILFLKSLGLSTTRIAALTAIPATGITSVWDTAISSIWHEFRDDVKDPDLRSAIEKALGSARGERQFGCAKGLITMADDFDESLEDFEEYT